MSALKYLVHFYSDWNYIFKTVTMYEEQERANVLSSIVKNKSWFWGRFSEEDRKNYMRRRAAVEEMLYSDFQDKYWKLKERIPIYLYLIPNMTIKEIDTELQKRQEHDEDDTKYIVIELAKIEKRANITFTLNDSFRSYRKRLQERGIPCRKIINKFAELEDYGKVFHIDEIEKVHIIYRDVVNLRYEVQVWDPNVLHQYIANQFEYRQ